MKHTITRVKHDVKMRHLSVAQVERITPNMIRIVFTGDDLTDFISLAPDDHVRLFFPVLGGEAESRHYTPRKFDTVNRTLVIDFAVHEAGPATQWALHARPGDRLQVGGPRGSAVVPDDFDWWLLIGDESALPTIGRRIEEMRAGIKVISIVSVAGAADEQRFETNAEHQAIWIHRPHARADDPQPVLAALQGISFPPGDGFIWVGTEAGVARAVRDYLGNACGHHAAWTKVSGYWIKGKADAHEKFDN